MAQLVEHHLAKVRVAGSNPVARSKENPAQQAEKGYDVDQIQRRRAGGRPAMGSGPVTVESVRLDPELKRQLLLRASKDGISVSEVIRKSLRSYVRVS